MVRELENVSSANRDINLNLPCSSDFSLFPISGFPRLTPSHTLSSTNTHKHRIRRSILSIGCSVACIDRDRACLFKACGANQVHSSLPAHFSLKNSIQVRFSARMHYFFGPSLPDLCIYSRLSLFSCVHLCRSCTMLFPFIYIYFSSSGSIYG